MPEGEKGSYIYNFEEINEKIEKLEMMFDLDSGHLELHRKHTQEITELKLRRNGSDRFKTLIGLKTNKTKEILQDLGKKVYDYIGAENFGSWNDFINKFSNPQLENKVEKVEKRLSENERVVGAIPSITSNKKKPIASSEIDSLNPKSCNHVFTSQYPFWECGKCNFVKFYKPSRCDECGGHIFSGYLLHAADCSHLHDKQEWSGSAASSFTRGDSDPVGSTPTPDSKIHELKTIPKYFKPLLERTKNFEIRINDRDFKVGDYLRLKEYSYGITKIGYVGYTGRELVVIVTYILRAEGSFFSFLDDYIIMAIRHLNK